METAQVGFKATCICLNCLKEHVLLALTLMVVDYVDKVISLHWEKSSLNKLMLWLSI